MVDHMKSTHRSWGRQVQLFLCRPEWSPQEPPCSVLAVVPGSEREAELARSAPEAVFLGSAWLIELSRDDEWWLRHEGELRWPLQREYDGDGSFEVVAQSLADRLPVVRGTAGLRHPCPAEHAQRRRTYWAEVLKHVADRRRVALSAAAAKVAMAAGAPIK